MSIFTGVSNQGNLQEAIENAISVAKTSIQSDYVEWKIGDVTGKDGGFTLVKELTVTIEVTKPTASETP